ncbi:hypothetical protein ARALYDRAFT_893708 [Arabidopsis lyrata subsp. lyrata]|uniref:MATH domain-containing protein n=1 Tax=Arabidopsis lyrata subsp. lyrata TaxID=81972 RepID=D7KYB1_ARALL|nr:hypothetical protein ARALYDRAFT_893708 [Arabidopsis lyrata subsp. lyrata]
MCTQISHSSLIKAVQTSTNHTKFDWFAETDAQRFHLFKQQWGLLTFLPLEYFRNPGYGYSFDDGSVVFGVDINTLKNGKFSLTNKTFVTLFSNGGSPNSLHSFMTLTLLITFLPVEETVYPNGVGNATGNSLSLYLLNESNDKGYVEAKLQIIDQNQSNHFVKKRFIPFSDRRNASKGYVVNDTLKFQVEILSFSKTDFYSHQSSVVLPISTGDST